MVRWLRVLPFAATILRIFTLAFILCVIPSLASTRESQRQLQPQSQQRLQADYLRNLVCRIVKRSKDPSVMLTPLVEVNLDALSNNPTNYTFSASINHSRRLEAAVRHVVVKLPRDRFNVSLRLDGKSYLKLNHVDLDIYIETDIDDETYILHCFPDVEK